MSQYVNLSDWKLTREELISCAMAYIFQYVNTSSTDMRNFKQKVGDERVNKFAEYLKTRLSENPDRFNPVKNGWDLADLFMALQDALEEEIKVKH